MQQALEYFGVITGLLYLVLEIKQHKAMWVVGFVTSLTYVFVFFFSRLYAVMGLQIYYVIMSVYGFLLWSGQKSGAEGADEAKRIVYSRVNLPVGAWLLAATVVFFGGISWVLKNFTDSPVPLGDGFVAALSLVATWMLARRIIEHWYCWIVANSCSAVICFSQGLYPTMALYICYAVLPVVGYLNWKKKGMRTA